MRLADLRAGCEIVLEKDLDVLVIDVQLLFKVIQFGLLKYFPPIAPEHGVLG
jgi:hypothetical protein